MPELSLDQQRKLEQLKIHLSSLRGLLGDKAGVATVVSSIAAAILIIATFNPNLLPITTGLKIAITILLALIPTSLLFYLLEMFHAIGKTSKAIEGVVGKVELPKGHWLEEFYNKLIGYSTLITSLILAGVIIYIIFIIWQ